MLNFHNSYYVKFFFFYYCLRFNHLILSHMDLRYTLTFKTPLGFKLRIIVDEKEIQHLINANLLMPWNYELLSYYEPKVYEFRYWIEDIDFSFYLKCQHYLYSKTSKSYPHDK